MYPGIEPTNHVGQTFGNSAGFVVCWIQQEILSLTIGENLLNS
jgi:hypothetical protein